MYSWVLAATPFLLELNIWGYASTIPLWRRTKRLLQAMQGMQGRAWLHCLGTSDTSARDREGGARASDGNLTEWWKHPVLGDWLSWFGFFSFIFYVVNFSGCWFDFRDIWQAPTDQRNKVPKDWQPPNYEAGMQGGLRYTCANRLNRGESGNPKNGWSLGSGWRNTFTTTKLRSDSYWFILLALALRLCFWGKRNGTRIAKICIIL